MIIITRDVPLRGPRDVLDWLKDLAGYLDELAVPAGELDALIALETDLSYIIDHYQTED